MQITIFGATGGTGRQLVRQALERGHRVTAVVRDPARLPIPAHPRLEVARADLAEADALATLVAGRDAVLSALGARTISAPSTVCAEGTRAITAAMHRTGVRRILVVSAAPLAPGGEGPLTRFVAKPILLRVFRHVYQDLRVMERLLHDDPALDWTVFRPPRLTDGPATGRYRSATGSAVRGGLRLSRADLAAAMLAAIDDDRTVRRDVAIAY